MDRKVKGGPRRSSSQPASNSDKKHLPETTKHIPIGIVECSLEGKYLSVNEEFCRISGYEKEELLRLGVKDLTYQEDYKYENKLYQRLIAGEIPFYQLEKRYMRKNGEIIWAQITRSLVRGADGKPRYTVGAVGDISERRRAEEEIRHLNTEIRARLDEMNTLLEILPTGVWIGNHDCSEIIGNPAAYRIMGLPPGINVSVTNPEPQTPSGMQIFVNEEEVPPEHAPMQQVARTGKPFHNFEHELLFVDGMRKTIYGSAVPLFDQHGAVRKVIASYADFTERKQAEAALREAKERYSRLFDLIPVAVYACDADGIIQEFNQSAAELWGREPQKNGSEEKYCGSFRLYYRDGRFMPHEECPMARMLKGKTIESEELEVIIERLDGSRRNVIAHPLILKNEHGEIVEAINCVYDITERKRAEAALQELNLQLESRVQDRTAELRALSQRLVEVQDEERRALARELHDSVGQKLITLNLNLIIVDEQISEASKQQIGSRLNDSMHLLEDVISLVRNVMTDLRPAVLDDYGLEAALQSYMAEYKSRYEIKVLFERAAQPIPRLGPSIEMTLLRIAQEALMNVARHAQVDQVTVSLQREENTIRLKIRDNGVGIDSLHEAARNGSHGLAIMRERAEAVGGNLKISSTPETGTEIEASIRFQNGGQS